MSELKDAAEAFIASVTPEMVEEVRAARATADAACRALDALSEKYGIPINTIHAGWFVPYSFAENFMTENYEGYDTFSADRLFEDDEDTTPEDAERLTNRIVEIVGDDYISGLDAWDTSHC